MSHPRSLSSSPQRGAGSRAAAWLRTSDGGLLVLALLVGVGAALLALVFRWLISTFTYLLSGFDDYAAHAGEANPWVPWLGPFFVVLTPVVAGLVYGPVVRRFAPEARGHGVPEVMYAVARNGGRIRPQVPAVKAFASALTIGGGGSVGREGPIVQIGSAWGSTLGQWLRMDESRLRVLVACGAGGGIAATFNTPLAGVFFAMELILADFAAQAFGMVVVSSVTASVISRAAIGDEAFLSLPGIEVGHVWEFALFAVLGLLGGALGVGFSKVLYAVEDLCDWVWRGPEWLRPAAGGLLLGLVLLVLPQMYGVGYPVLDDAVGGQYAIGFLLVLLVGKMIATSLTIGIGGSGGVFAPSLFVGAMFGAAFGQAASLLTDGSTSSAGAYAVIGMGAAFAGATRAPITGVVILFELTGDYALILPLMVAIVLATGLSHRLTKETIYTLKLARRGVDLLRNPETIAVRRRVRDVMLEVPEPLPAGTRMADAVEVLARSGGVLPLVDADGEYVGTVTAATIAHHLADGASDDDPVSLVEQHPDRLRTDDSLADALAALEAARAPAVPVHGAADGAEEDRVVGWLTYPAALSGMR
ncbi:chloride channel protein [Nocardioides bruguierae]|uniref:chloride channel protein n=1 Tax=Nocardioides bruguierae TaxID=2945102 RepID=UPI00202133F3|nr:chloride channel protein [Nocardioides bruguierae]MCL8027193.1 chloride channel protein [Nocardioides bruguierae]